MINICLVACPTNCPNISPSSCVWVHFQYFYLDCMKLSMTVVYPSRQKWTIAESKTENLPPLDFCINPIKSGSTDQQLWSSFIYFYSFLCEESNFLRPHFDSFCMIFIWIGGRTKANVYKPNLLSYSHWLKYWQFENTFPYFL